MLVLSVFHPLHGTDKTVLAQVAFPVFTVQEKGIRERGLTGLCVNLSQNIVNQKKQEEEDAQAALDVGKPTKASGVPQPAAPAGEKRRNRWDQSAGAECVAYLGRLHK